MNNTIIEEGLALANKHKTGTLDEDAKVGLAMLSVGLTVMMSSMTPRQIATVLYGHADYFAVVDMPDKNAK